MQIAPGNPAKKRRHETETPTFHRNGQVKGESVDGNGQGNGDPVEQKSHGHGVMEAAAFGRSQTRCALLVFENPPPWSRTFGRLSVLNDLQHP